DRPQLGVAALEQRLEDVAEVLLDLHERLDEQLARGHVDLGDCLEQLAARLQEILALLREEQPALLLLRVLLEREQVHHAGPAQTPATSGWIPAHASSDWRSTALRVSSPASSSRRDCSARAHRASRSTSSRDNANWRSRSDCTCAAACSRRDSAACTARSRS